MRGSTTLNALVTIIAALSFGLLPGSALAMAQVSLIIGDPDPEPEIGSEFETTLSYATRDAVLGAFFVTLHYNPEVIRVVDVTILSGSEFSDHGFIDSTSFASGRTGIDAFQLTWDSETTAPVSFATVRWEVRRSPTACDEIGIEPNTIIDSSWRPVEIDNPNMPLLQNAGSCADAPDCSDSADNDGDGLTDFPGDPGCAGADDLSENTPLTVCDDGADNDADGLIDFPGDPGCGDPTASLEDPECDDGLDNDGDGGTDWDGSPPDAECLTSWQEHESVIPVPEPPQAMALPAGILLLAALGRFRRSREHG